MCIFAGQGFGFTCILQQSFEVLMLNKCLVIMGKESKDHGSASCDLLPKGLSNFVISLVSSFVK